jgi:hypothetical protein
MQHELLFTDLTTTQAETIAGGIGKLALIRASYGYAESEFGRTGRNSFIGNLYVKDQVKDGFPVYAKFQVRATDGSILTTQTERFDLKGAAGSGTFYTDLRGAFSKNITQLRVVLFRRNPGRDLFSAGQWVDLPLV